MPKRPVNLSLDGGTVEYLDKLAAEWGIDRSGAVVVLASAMRFLRHELGNYAQPIGLYAELLERRGDLEAAAVLKVAKREVLGLPGEIVRKALHEELPKRRAAREGPKG